MSRLDEYGQLYTQLPRWAPQPPYKANGRPALTMVQFLTKYHGEEQHMATTGIGTGLRGT